MDKKTKHTKQNPHKIATAMYYSWQRLENLAK